jgi:glutamine cyclotransferase
MAGRPGAAWLFFFLAAGAAVFGASGGLCAQEAAPLLSWRVAAEHPHDPEAFTQGLFLRDGALYESTGRYGLSSLRRVDPATGRVLARRDLPAAYFGEGLAEHGGRLYQLTWRENVVLVFDAATFDALDQKRLPTEGWGICHDGTSFVVSDGTSVLRRYDPAGFAPGERIRVTAGGAPVEWLNELECVDGRILANVWQTDRVAVIDPGDGRVAAWIDLSGLRAFLPRLSPEAVTNGLAYDPATGRLWVTGKLWPKIFELEMDRLPPVGGKEAP